MLNIKNLKDKTYEQRMAEAILQIPLYTKEWTNFNISDPGITILELLTAFETSQLADINEITLPIKRNLLKMVGFSEKKGRCARVLLTTDYDGERIALPAGAKIRLGSTCFETLGVTEVGGYKLLDVYGIREGKRYEYDFLLDREVPIPAHVFGKSPAKGHALYFASNDLPEPGEEVIFYFTAQKRTKRNDSADKNKNPFADIVWECFTEDGYQPMNVRDNTCAFLESGEVRMRLPQAKAVPCTEVEGAPFLIRARLESASFDMLPAIISVEGFLFEAWQKETKSVCITSNKVSQVNVYNDLLEEGYVSVFCKEEKGSSYRKYERAGWQEQGRFYDVVEEGYGMHSFIFDKKRYGYGPEKVKNAVKILIYNEEIMRTFSLGTVLGFDDQVIDLPVQRIVNDNFSILAKRIDENGEDIYDFVRPDRYGEDELTYHLLENDGRILIEDAGAFIGAELYMCGCSVTLGADGNVRAGNYFVADNQPKDLVFYNPGEGTGGCLREKIADVRKRYQNDVSTPYVAVTAADFESLVAETPQLCISKVKAVMDRRRNLVLITVLPGTEEKLPQISPLYKKLISERLEERRLLTTRVELVQPTYVQINVNATIYVKRHFENCLPQIEKVISDKLDYIHSEKNFGDLLTFDEIFHAVENLDCVEFIYDMSIRPQNLELAKMQDADILPNYNCLCVPGNIAIEISTSTEG